MTRSPVATHAEVSAFIRTDPEFGRCLADVAAELGIDGFLPYESAVLGMDQRRLMLTGHGLDAMRELLTEAHDLVVRFTVISVRELSGSDIPDQEWPPGEEPAEDDADTVVEVLGYDPTLLFAALCDLLVLGQQDPKALESYLKSLRLPGIRARRAALSRAYREATAPLHEG